MVRCHPDVYWLLDHVARLKAATGLLGTNFYKRYIDQQCLSGGNQKAEVLSSYRYQVYVKHSESLFVQELAWQRAVGEESGASREGQRCSLPPDLQMSKSKQASSLAQV